MFHTYTTMPVVNATTAGTMQTVRHALSVSPSKIDLKIGKRIDPTTRFVIPVLAKGACRNAVRNCTAVE